MNTPELPKQEDLAALRVLDEIEKNPDLTQREISKRVGISLGLTNLLIKRMARKAWIKIGSVPGRRVLYALTPKGMTEKVRKMRDFVRLTLRHHVDMKRSLVDRILETGKSKPRVAAVGAGELREIVAEAAQEAGGRFVGSYDDFKVNGKADVLILFEKAAKPLQKKWERKGIAIIDLS